MWRKENGQKSFGHKIFDEEILFDLDFSKKNVIFLTFVLHENQNFKTKIMKNNFTNQEMNLIRSTKNRKKNNCHVENKRSGIFTTLDNKSWLDFFSLKLYHQKRTTSLVVIFSSLFKARMCVYLFLLAQVNGPKLIIGLK